MDRNHLNNFERGPTKDHSCEVWSNSHQWFRRCCLKIVDGRTSGCRRRRRTVSDHNSSPWAFGSGELKKTTRGPWWSYIAHLTKQICIFTVEVSAKFTALGFLYKLYSTNHPHPPPSHPRPCFVCLCWGFTAQSTQLGHVERCQFT